MRFGLLGPVTIADGGTSTSVGRSQRRGLLAYLLLHPSRWISAEAITEALWGGAEPASARQQIQTSMHAIRSELRRLGPEDVIESSGSGYRLDLTRHRLDVSDFIELVTAARQCSRAGAFGESERQLMGALELWRGTALADASGSFVESARAGLEDQRINATEDLLAVRLALGRHTEVLAALGPLLLAHPLRERLRGQHMLALYRDGRQVDALEAFRAFRELLIDEHGLDPHPDLQALERAILCADPVLSSRPPALASAATGPAAPVARSVLVAPPTAGQTSLAAGPNPVPASVPAPVGAPVPALVLTPVPAQLPAAPSDFTGRTAELAKLDEALAATRSELGRPATVLINTVDGAGGVGKTATAVAWAHRVRDQFPDGQLYLNMHGYSTMPPVTPLTALHRLLEALGVAPELAPVELEAAASLYRTRMASRRMLILIDNVNDVDQVRPLLPGHAGCLVLVTSRARLTGLIAREGARRVSLDGLSPEEARTLLARVLGPDRVAAEPEAAAEIAQACGHLPLALRIVAGNLHDRPEITLADHAQTLAKAGRLDEFEVDGDPQASVRVALTQSYGALDPGPRRVFRLLGLVPGPDTTVPIVAALAGLPADRAAAALDRLETLHLIDEVTPGRFALHDLVRVFAQERAATEESADQRDRAVQRLFGYYLASLDVVAQRLYPQFVRLESLAVPDVPGDAPADEAAALAWGEANRASILAAVRWAAAGPQRRLAAHLADAYRGFFWIRRHMADWLDMAGAVQTAADELRDDRLITAAALSVGMAYRAQSDYGPSAEHLERALDASRRAGWVEAEASALGSMAIVHGELCDFAAAMRSLTEAIELNRRIGRRAGIAVAQGNLASYKLRTGDLPGAQADSLAALELYREVGAIGGEAIVLSNLASTSWGLGEFTAGLSYAEQALALQERIGDQSGAALTLYVRCMINIELGDLDAASNAADQAAEYSRASEDRPREAETLIAAGSVALARGNPEEALGHCLAAVAMARELRAANGEARGLNYASRALLRLGRVTESIAHARQAVEVARHGFLLGVVGEGLTVLADSLVAAGELDEAREHIEEALVAVRACADRRHEAPSLVVVGRLELASGRPGAAVRAWSEAEAMFAAMGSVAAVDVRELLSHVDGQALRQASAVSGPSSGSDSGSAGTA